MQKAATKIMTDADERARQRTAMRATMEQLDTLFADDLLAKIDRTKAEQTLAKVESALEMEVHVKETRAAYEAYMIQADEKLKQLAQQAKDQFDKACQAFGGTSPTPDEQRVLEKIQSQFQTVCAAGAIIFQATEDIDSGLKLLAATQKKINQILDNKIEPLVTEGAQQARQAANVATTAAENAIRWAMIVIFTVLLAGLAIGGGVAFNISQRITGPLARMVQLANAIADGDLTLPRLSETSDEPGRVAGGFNRMVRSLKDLLAQTQQLSGQLGERRRRSMWPRNNSSPRSTNRPRRSTRSRPPRSSSRRPFRSLPTGLAPCSRRRTKHPAGGGRANAVAGVHQQDEPGAGQLRGRRAERLDPVRADAAGYGNHRHGERNRRANEAAGLERVDRSGPRRRRGQGVRRGGDQVRELANQSKEAAGRIASVIKETQKMMVQVVRRIEDGSRLSGESSEMVQNMGHVFDDVVVAFEQTTEAMKQITDVAEQQEHGIVELVTSLGQIDNGAKQSLASAQQTQKAIAAIDRQVQTLNDGMEKYGKASRVARPTCWP